MTSRPASSRRIKLLTILAGVLVAGVTLLSWTQPWFRLVISSTFGGRTDITVDGDVAGGSLSALALASLALFGALTIAGRVFRIVLGVLQVLLGVAVVVTATSALVDPVASSSSAITSATGVDGADSVRHLVDQAVATPWPFVGLVAGVVATLLGLAVVLLAGRWPVATKKYQAVRLVSADPADDPAAAWDSLSGGGDPTDGHPAPGDTTR
ncbi:Trp biosynthesis-associated membrane protein [Frigoribacterium sp. 2-23]|uniref:Trp biosynthesis-associated membrane protein n=1 Tax=Frigoribacterium sp. 2-23 TaxID=3415006 RepID=UPI003C6FFC96